MKGSPAAKERVLAILGNLGGTVATSEASSRLRVSPALVRRLRETLLEAALRALEPRPRGRPLQVVPKYVRDLRKLEVRLADLEEELELARVREQIALALPWTRRSQKRATSIPPRRPAETPSGSPAA